MATKITVINKAACNAIAADIVAALKSVEEKYGVTITRGNAKYTVCSVDLQIKVALAGEIAEEKAKQDFALSASVLRLPEDWYGKSFKDGAKTMTIVGIKLNAPKNPIMLKDQDGVSYKAPVGYVRKFIG